MSVAGGVSFHTAYFKSAFEVSPLANNTLRLWNPQGDTPRGNPLNEDVVP